MNVLMVRARLKEETVDYAQAAIGKVIQALERARPADVRYTASLLSDGVTFIALLELKPDGGHPLATLPAYTELVEDLKQSYAEPPTVCGAHDGHRLVPAILSRNRRMVGLPSRRSAMRMQQLDAGVVVRSR